MKKLFFVLCLLCCAVFADEIALVKNGKPVSEIVIPEKPTRSVQMAAFELQHLVQLITGAELTITTRPGKAMLPVYLGPAKEDKFVREQYKVSIGKDAIRLAGNDSQDFGKVDYKKAQTYPGTYNNYRTPEHYYNYHSTLYAVYDFLENSCGMKFYSFGDDGLTYTPRKTLTVKTGERSYEPKSPMFRYAGTQYRDSVRKTTPEERALLALRWRMNVMCGETNHMTDSLIWRYWGPARGYEKVFIEKRPQYFIRGYEKMPTGDSAKLYPKNNPPPAQACTSHPDVIRYFASEAQKVYETAHGKRPFLEGVRFRLIKALDGKPFHYPIQEADNSYFCRCPECSELFAQIKGNDRYAYVHFDFVNKVAREAKKLNPDIKISTLAYNKAFTYPDPKYLKLEPNVAVQMCLGVHSWMHPQIYNRQHTIYKRWVKNEGKKRPLTVWTYILSPDNEARRAFNYRNFPVLFPWQVGRIYQEFMNDGIQGVFLELCTKVNLLEGYIAMRLAFDPAQDPDQIIDEYFKLYYREAAEPMKEFYREIETITWNWKNYPQKDINAYAARNGWGSAAMSIHTQKVNWALGTPERMAKLQKIVDRIKASAKTPAVQKRVDIFLKDIWDRALQGRREFEQRLQVEKDPPPVCTPAYLAQDGKERDTKYDWVNWNAIRTTGPWSELKTRKTLSADAVQVRMAFTDDLFLIRYEEKGGMAQKYLSKDLWTNGIEIFFGEKAEYPFWHYAIGANGKTAGYRHILRDGAPVLERLDMSDVNVIQNQTGTDSWSFILAVPRRNTPLQKAGVVRMNIIRNSPEGRPMAWSYLAPTDYASSLFRMGYVHLPQSAQASEFMLPADFAKWKNGRDAWMQNHPNAKKEPSVKIQNGKATLYNAKSMVHLMTLISPLIKSGDKVIFEFTASGTGKGGVGLYFYSAKGKHSAWWYGAVTEYFEAEKSEKKCCIVIDTAKLEPKYREISRCRPFLYTAPGATVTFSNMKITPDPVNGTQR